MGLVAIFISYLNLWFNPELFFARQLKCIQSSAIHLSAPPVVNKESPTIFVQIASYRDPELIPTLQDMLNQAKRPENLRIGLCHQYHPEDEFDQIDLFREDSRFQIIDVLYNETKGVCWARNQVQKLYNGESYTLQIDSHMRFAKHWDETLMGMILNLQAAGIPKPLLTAYVPSYDPANDPEGRVQEPWRMNFDRFIPEGAVFFIPEIIPDWQSLHAPVPARFYSAHMAFTLGSFAEEVPHNPEYYFHGEEISICVRAYTHGYDLFHPHEVVLWHEYTRKGRVKQWDDDTDWNEKNNASHFTNRKLFGMDGEPQSGHDGPFGFGTSRSLQDYESYSGLSFSKRAVQQYTLDKRLPPNPGPEAFDTQEAWEASFLPIFKHCIDLHRSMVPEEDYDFWAVAFHDKEHNTLFRRDSVADEIREMKDSPDEFLKIWREFPSSNKPDYWVVWPHSVSKGWCQRLTGQL